MKRNLIKTSYTFWDNFQTCPKKCEIRHIRGIYPLEKERKLWLGGLVHIGLETWFDSGNMELVVNRINAERSKAFTTYQNFDFLFDINEVINQAIGILHAYVQQYPQEIFTIELVETVFEHPIINPKTGAKSKTFYLLGKIDGVVKNPDGTLWVLEHKTASDITANYLERLWGDYQLKIYVHLLQQLGFPVVGSIYDIVKKPTIRQKREQPEETEAEFKIRYDEACSKNKSGKTNIKRELGKPAESDESYIDRIIEWYAQSSPDNLTFHREEIFFTEKDKEEISNFLWFATQNFLFCQRAGYFPRNTANCMNKYNSLCEYHKLCSSDENPNILNSFYTTREQREEIRRNSNAEVPPVPHIPTVIPEIHPPVMTTIPNTPQSTSEQFLLNFFDVDISPTTQKISEIPGLKL